VGSEMCIRDRYTSALQNGKYQIDASAWGSGMYILELQSQKGIKVSKIVKH
jgi:hypothetical protein